jgi:glyoxylase-like metal-dependent hydrolase (beta-lactamase superfamily II)
MAEGTLRVGNVEIIELTDAHVRFPMPLRQLFPGVSEESWATYQERYPDAFYGPDTWHGHFGGQLVRSSGQTILVDTGFGPTPRDLFDNQPGGLLDDLRAQGVSPEDIDVVFTTHAHPDHVGWNMTSDGKPTFPRARYFMHQADWDAFHTSEVQSALPYAYVGETVTPLKDLGALELLNGEHVLTAEVTAIPAPGHTPGHMALMITSGSERAIILGDTMGHPLQVTEPDVPFGFDGDLPTAVSTRKQMLDRLEESGIIGVVCHFPGSGFGRVIRLEGRRYWEGIS